MLITHTLKDTDIKGRFQLPHLIAIGIPEDKARRIGWATQLRYEIDEVLEDIIITVDGHSKHVLSFFEMSHKITVDAAILLVADSL